MDDSCPPRQTQDRTHGPPRRFRPRSRAPATLLPLPWPSARRWKAPGATRKQSGDPGSTPRLPTLGLPLPRPLHTDRSSSVQAHLRHRNASLRSQLPDPDEDTWSRRSRHDHALRRYRPHRLEREFQLARSKPRHLAPQPKTSAPVRAGLDGLIDFLIAAQHTMEMFRRSLPNGPARNRLLRLSKRIFKILAEIRKLRTT